MMAFPRRSDTVMTQVDAGWMTQFLRNGCRGDPERGSVMLLRG